MLNNQSFWRRKRPISSDTNLTALLQEWRGITPGATFEADVWNKIQHNSQPILREWVTSQFAWVNALAAAAGLVLGVGLAFNAPSTPTRNDAGPSLLHTHTLAGSYLTMAAGGIR